MAAQQQSAGGSSSSSSSSSLGAGSLGGGGGGGASAPAADVAALERQLYTAGCPPVDLLVRTSGETRLSDFLLWQSRHALLVFTQVLWPDFGFLDLAAAVLQYQRHAPHLRRLHAAADEQARATAAAAAAAAGGSQAAAQAPQRAAVGAAVAEGVVRPPLQLVKVAAAQQRGSPCSMASPASPSSPSSPSSRSDASDDMAVAANSAALADVVAAAAAAPLAVRQRHAVAAGSIRPQQSSVVAL